MRHEIAVGEGLDKYWFRNCHGCWLYDWSVYTANGRGMERSCAFLSHGGICIFQHCPRYLKGKGLKAQPSVFFRTALIHYSRLDFAVLSPVRSLPFLVSLNSIRMVTLSRQEEESFPMWAGWAFCYLGEYLYSVQTEMSTCSPSSKLN